MKLILASSSPRRAEILHDAGIPFDVCAPQVDEAPIPGELVTTMVARLAKAKVHAAVSQGLVNAKKCVIVGADTAVELDGEIFGKPRDPARASKMLAALSGRIHNVVTGISLLRLPDGAMRSAVETTAVTFASLDHDEIAAYAASGEPMGKAGAYAIQGRAGKYIPRIDGCYFNVVGLPLTRLYVLLRDLGWPPNSEV